MASITGHIIPLLIQIRKNLDKDTLDDQQAIAALVVYNKGSRVLLKLLKAASIQPKHFSKLHLWQVVNFILSEATVASSITPSIPFPTTTSM